MWLELNVAEVEPSSKQRVYANIEPSSRLPMILAELGHHERTKTGDLQTCSCCVLSPSIFDPRNFNLSAAQKKLKLDHDRLGHLSMQAIQRLYQPADTDSPDFDGHSVSGVPCLLAKDPVQLCCDLPMCEACQLAKARRRPAVPRGRSR